MRIPLPMFVFTDEPTTDDLATIEKEWPVIEAELAQLDAEIVSLNAEDGPSQLDWRRLRRAEQRVMSVRRASRRPVDSLGRAA